MGHKRATVRSILAAARRDGVRYVFPICLVYVLQDLCIPPCPDRNNPHSVEEAAAWARVDGGSSLPHAQFNGQQPTAVAPTLPRVLADIPRWARELQKARF